MDVCGAGTSNEGEFAQAEVICSLRGKCGWKTCRSRFTPQPPRRKRDHHPSYGPSAACWATATSIGARLHWVQALSSLWWTVVGAGVLPGLSCPCLGWKKGLAERGVGKQCKVTGCCFFFFFSPALANLCSSVHSVERVSFPLPVKAQRQRHGRNNRAYFSSGQGYFGAARHSVALPRALPRHV